MSVSITHGPADAERALLRSCGFYPFGRLSRKFVVGEVVTFLLLAGVDLTPRTSHRRYRRFHAAFMLTVTEGMLRPYLAAEWSRPSSQLRLVVSGLWEACK